MLYYHGRGGKERDADNAVNWMRKAAEDGDGESQLWMSRASLHNFGGAEERDALGWCERAIVSGNTEALVHRVLLDRLLSTPLTAQERKESEDKARQLLDRAKSHGEVRAYWLLSRLTANISEQTALLQRATQDKSDETLYVLYRHWHDSKKWRRIVLETIHADELECGTIDAKIVRRHWLEKEEARNYYEECESEERRLLKRMETSDCIFWIEERAYRYASEGKEELAATLWEEVVASPYPLVSHLPPGRFESCIRIAHFRLGNCYEQSSKHSHALRHYRAASIMGHDDSTRAVERLDNVV